MDGKNIKEEIIQKVSDDLSMNSRIVREIVDHQFEVAREKMATCESIEFSGFVRFHFNRKRAVKKLENWQVLVDNYEKELNSKPYSEKERAKLHMKYMDIISNMKLLKDKMRKYDEKHNKTVEGDI